MSNVKNVFRSVFSATVVWMGSQAMAADTDEGSGTFVNIHMKIDGGHYHSLFSDWQDPDSVAGTVKLVNPQPEGQWACCNIHAGTLKKSKTWSVRPILQGR